MQEGPQENPAEATPYEAVRGDERYQFEAEGLPPPEPVRRDDASLFDGPFWEAIGAFLRFVLPILFWGALALFVVFLAYQLARYAHDRLSDRERDEPDEAPAYAPAPAVVRTLLDDAAKLAAEGRYGDAVRLLLRRSVEDVDRRHPGTIRDSMTSREIAGLGVLTALAREAFARIAALVEAAHFAGRPLSARDWEEARAMYERLAEARPKSGRGSVRAARRLA